MCDILPVPESLVRPRRLSSSCMPGGGRRRTYPRHQASHTGVPLSLGAAKHLTTSHTQLDRPHTGACVAKSAADWRLEHEASSPPATRPRVAVAQWPAGPLPSPGLAARSSEVDAAGRPQAYLQQAQTAGSSPGLLKTLHSTLPQDLFHSSSSIITLHQIYHEVALSSPVYHPFSPFITLDHPLSPFITLQRQDAEGDYHPLSPFITLLSPFITTMRRVISTICHPLSPYVTLYHR